MVGIRNDLDNADNMSKIAESVKGEDMRSPASRYSNMQGSQFNQHAP